MQLHHCTIFLLPCCSGYFYTKKGEEGKVGGGTYVVKVYIAQPVGNTKLE